MFIDGGLIPIRYLINDASIVQEQEDRITYWHIELPQHDILFAEGLAAESYLDTGNRSAFENCGPATDLHADFGRRVWENFGCAPLVLGGAELEAARSHLLERAHFLGYSTTRDPAPYLLIAGSVQPPEIEGRILRFRLPATLAGVRLLSRSTVPAYVSCDSEDHRRLGTAISRVLLDGQPIPLVDAQLSSGWHELECGNEGAQWRWTNGDAGFAFACGHILELEVAMTERYWVGDRPIQKQSAVAA